MRIISVYSANCYEQQGTAGWKVEFSVYFSTSAAIEKQWMNAVN